MYNLTLKKTESFYNNNDLIKANSLISEQIDKCFTYKRVPSYFSGKRLLKYYIYLKNALSEKEVITIIVDIDGNIYSVRCKYCDRYVLCPHGIMMVKAIEKENLKNDEFEEAFLKLEEEERKARYEKEKAEHQKKLDSVVSLIKQTDLIGLNQKVHIEATVDFSGEKKKLFLKVGTDKFYVIQKIDNFLNSVSNGEIVGYGKKFSFAHSLENFDDISQKLIMFLASTVTYDYSGTKYAILSNVKLQNLFKIYEKEHLLIKFSVLEKDVYISDEVFEVKMNLTKDYKLLLPVGSKYIEGYSYDFVYYKDCIYRSNISDTSLRKFLSFIDANPDFSYDYVKDAFSKEIYPRFHNHINIDSSLSNELKLIDYTIKGYFDMTDEGLVSFTKYYCNDKEVKISEMSPISFKLAKYDGYIKGLGFDENGIIKDPMKIVYFLRADFSGIREVAEIYLSDKIKQMQIKSYTKPSSYLTYKTGMLDICFEKSAFSDEELEKIIKGLRKKTRFIKLNKDTIVEVDEHTANQLINTVDEFNLDIKKLSVPQTIPLYQSLKLECKDIDLINYNVDKNLRNLLDDISNFRNFKEDVPDSLKDIMRPYQKEAFKWMKTLIKYNFCGVLADDMGLGKTIEVISVLLSDETAKPALIVCPKSLCYNWKNEFELWAPNLDVINIIGSAFERKALVSGINNGKRVIYITSYDSLRNDIDFYADKKFRYMILDEAQSIKNRETLKAKSVKEVDSEIRFVLTGTPIENTIIDLWSIFDFLMPNYLSSYLNFKGRYEKAIVEAKDDDVIKRLVKKISPFVLRRTKKEVLKDLPDKVEIIQMASMEKEQRKVYEAQLKKTRDMLESSGNRKIELLACLTRLRQICVDPSLFIDTYEGRSAKVDLVCELIGDYIADGHKIILFSQFTSVFSILEKAFNKYGYKYYELTGKTSAEERMRLSNEFNKSNNDCNVFLISLKAGGTGLNLVGADIVIHMDPWWNYAVENQATDRAHRIGQKNVVQVIKIICENSIEQKVIELQKIKKEVADRIILSDEDNYENITVNDIEYLLKY